MRPPAPESTPTPKPVRRVIREVTDPGLVHPALIPGIGVERTGRVFRTNRAVFAIAGVVVLAVVLWGFVAPQSLGDVGAASLTWVTGTFGWLFTVLTIGIVLFMLWVGFGRTGGIRLGADDERPEYSTISWIAMLFSAGMGIGLLFYGPSEPLTFFLDVPYGFDAEPGTPDAMLVALAQTALHWGPMAWAYYALVGGAIAYAAYRRGRSPLISAIFEPIFGARTQGPLGAVIDIFAIIVTLFGTAVSLGIGALQIGRGVQVVTGVGELGNGFLVGTIAVLTALFVVSAVSGIKRGIRALSNVNMVIAGILGLFIFVTGPTLVLLNLLPSSIVTFVAELGTMMLRSGVQGEDAAAFMSTWTTYYWAWWVSWTPFVGMFIAKISRGRTLRQFVTVVVLVPSLVCVVWFGIVGGTTMWLEMQGAGIAASGSPEAQLFAVIGALPLAPVVSVLALVSIVIFFVTSADSASIVMGSISQGGRPEPARWVTIVWGLLLGASALALLLAGGETALSGLRSMMVVTALPFAIVVIGIAIAWAKDLRTDPVVLRQRYARAAIAEGVRRGIAEHGDDFAFSAGEVEASAGAGAWLDSDDPALSEWYVEAATGSMPIVTTPADPDEARVDDDGPASRRTPAPDAAGAREPRDGDPRAEHPGRG